MSREPKMQIDIWSDVVCPFCYIGKRHFEQALQQFADADILEIIWHSFQLDPDLTGRHENIYQYLADKKGMSYHQSVDMHKHVTETACLAGLTYNFGKAILVNTFKAHRIIQFAKTAGLGDQAEERFFLAYFTEGKDLGDDAILIELGSEIGLQERQVLEALDNDEYAEMVTRDINEARRIGIRGVPFFIFNRKYAVSGAQPSELFLEALEKAFAEWKNQNPI